MKLTQKFFLAYLVPVLRFMAGLAGGLWAPTQTQGDFRHHTRLVAGVGGTLDAVVTKARHVADIMGESTRHFPIQPKRA